MHAAARLAQRDSLNRSTTADGMQELTSTRPLGATSTSIRPPEQLTDMSSRTVVLVAVDQRLTATRKRRRRYFQHIRLRLWATGSERCVQCLCLYEGVIVPSTSNPAGRVKRGALRGVGHFRVITPRAHCKSFPVRADG